jgi:hypothetical protein
MTRRPPVRLLSGAVFLVLLSSCAGSGSGVDPAADAAAASAANGDRSSSDSATGTPAAPGDGNHGNPGGPGADPADGGGEDDGQAKGNPGGPGDEAVFEEGGGAEYSALVNDAATKCANGVCTLKEPPIILDGHVDRVEGGVGKCTIEKKTDILYHPSAQGGRFPHGATVQAQVHCADVETPVDEPAGDSPAGDSPAGDSPGQDPANPDAGTPAGDTTSSPTADQPQG